MYPDRVKVPINGKPTTKGLISLEGSVLDDALGD